jgi:hypothetical protein
MKYTTSNNNVMEVGAENSRNINGQCNVRLAAGAYRQPEITSLELTESQPSDTLDGTGFNVYNGKAEKQCYTLGGIGKRVLRIPVPKINKTGLDESSREY